jgi:aspartyl aminopeptidase
MARKIKIPRETHTNFLLDDVVREYPALDCLTGGEREDLYRRIERLVDFEKNARTPIQVVDYIAKWLAGRPEFEERDIADSTKSTKKKYFFRDRWEGASMVIVKEGQLPLEHGFRLLLSHSDAPCLRVKPRPIRLDWQPNEMYNYPGIRLSAVPHGGISVHQWVGQQVHLIGHSRDRHNNKITIELPGVVGDYSAHADYRKEDEDNPFSPERSLEIITGHGSKRQILDRMGFSSQDDFSFAKLYGVPTNRPLLIDEDSWRLLVAYGHDDRVSDFSAVDAIIKARKPDVTSIVWITGSEETGDNPPSGVGGSFLDQVLDHMIEKQRRRTPRRKQIHIDHRKIMYTSSMIIADVDIAPFGPDAENMDAESAPKIGLGTAINTDEDSASDTAFSRGMKNLAVWGATKIKKICG